MMASVRTFCRSISSRIMESSSTICMRRSSEAAIFWLASLISCSCVFRSVMSAEMTPAPMIWPDLERTGK